MLETTFFYVYVHVYMCKCMCMKTQKQLRRDQNVRCVWFLRRTNEWDSMVAGVKEEKYVVEMRMENDWWKY